MPEVLQPTPRACHGIYRPPYPVSQTSRIVFVRRDPPFNYLQTGWWPGSVKPTRFGQRFVAHELEEVLEGHGAVVQPLDGKVFEGFAINFHDQLLAESIHLKDQQPSAEPGADVVVVFVQLDRTIGFDPAFEAFAMDGQQPAIGIDLVGQRRQLWERRKSDIRRSVTAAEAWLGRSGCSAT
jgi:hypothetical protein